MKESARTIERQPANLRDRRPPLKPDAVARGLESAADALAGIADARIEPGPEYAQLRRAFHVLSDDGRRAAILRLLLEESERIRHDRSVTMSGHSAVAVGQGAKGSD